MRFMVGLILFFIFLMDFPPWCCFSPPVLDTFLLTSEFFINVSTLERGRIARDRRNTGLNVTCLRAASVQLVLLSVCHQRRRVRNICDRKWVLESQPLFWGGIFLIELHSLWHQGDPCLCVYVCILYKGCNQRILLGSQESKHSEVLAVPFAFFFPLWCWALWSKGVIPDGFMLNLCTRGN